MEKGDEILASLHSFKTDVMQRFNDGDKRFDRQDVALTDLQDQIKGNEDKGIEGLRPVVKEYGKILIIPIMVRKLPVWAKWLLAAICVDALADINSIGLISCLKFLLHLTKP